MLLDYERYQRRSSKKKYRIVVVILLLAAFGAGAFLLISQISRNNRFFDFLTFRSPEENLDRLWSELVRDEQAPRGAQAEKRDDERKKLLDEILRLSGEYLKDQPLSARGLIYHGYASFYRALNETSFDKQVPFLNQAVVSLRRALSNAGNEIRPQLSYMLGRVYFYKRSSYYDLAARYLEQALKLGYKKAEVFEYLVLVYNEWGATDKAISYLQQAYAEKRNGIYLFYLAKNYKKVNRTTEAREMLTRVMTDPVDAELLKECKFLLGEILFDQANYPQAEKLYRDIIATDENSAEAHFRLALIYEKLGDYAQYRYELRVTLEKDRGHSGARSRL
jgi:tetratricopeptide (TPR) repeat protein